MKKAAFCICKDSVQLNHIVDVLRANHYSNDSISVMFPDKSSTKEFAVNNSTKAPEGANVGAGAGGVVGGTLGLLVGLGALAIPGLGPFIAAGPIVVAMAGVAAGAAVGGVTGALIGFGIPEYEAKLYEGHLRNGGILLSVHAGDSRGLTRAKQIFKQAGATDISVSSEAAVPNQPLRM